MPRPVTAGLVELRSGIEEGPRGSRGNNGGGATGGAGGEAGGGGNSGGSGGGLGGVGCSGEEWGGFKGGGGSGGDNGGAEWGFRCVIAASGAVTAQFLQSHCGRDSSEHPHKFLCRISDRSSAVGKEEVMVKVVVVKVTAGR